MIAKTALCLAFFMVGVEDFKTRTVHWFWFPIIAIAACWLLYSNLDWLLFYQTIIFNGLVISILLLSVFMYAKLKLKVPFFQVIGLGDVLLLVALSFTFSNAFFLVSLVVGLVCALALHLIYNRVYKTKTVPLAGYLSLFFLAVYLGHWTGLLTTLYQL